MFGHIFFHAALEQARAARAQGEVPVGAVIVYQGQIIARGHNACIHAHDASAHAEIEALRAAGQVLGNYRLSDCQMYVTLEPCAMCAAAIAQARLRDVFYAVRDARAGAAGSVIDLFAHPAINHHSRAQYQPLTDDLPLQTALQNLLPDFFQEKRLMQATIHQAQALRPDALRTPEADLEEWIRRFAKRTTCQSVYSLLRGVDFAGEEAGAGALPWRMHAFYRAPSGADAPFFIGLHNRPFWAYAFLDFCAQLPPEAGFIIPDMLGFGASDKPKKTAMHTIQQHAQLLTQLLEIHHPPRMMESVNVHAVLQSGEAADADDWLAARWTALQSSIPALANASVHRIPPMDARADVYRAPYPDKGHQAALENDKNHYKINSCWDNVYRLY